MISSEAPALTLPTKNGARNEFPRPVSPSIRPLSKTKGKKKIIYENRNPLECVRKRGNSSAPLRTVCSSSKAKVHKSAIESTFVIE